VRDELTRITPPLFVGLSALEPFNDRFELAIEFHLGFYYLV
jgi:hypothetical protein